MARQVYFEDNCTKLCFKCRKNLDRIRGQWRCPGCDTYCLKCGGIVEEKDIKCPEWGIKFEE